MEAQISAFKLENDSALPEKLPFLMSQLERAKNELSALEREIYGTHEQQRLMELELSVRTAGLTGESASPAGSVTQQLIAALNMELLKKRSVYTDTHPDIQSLKRQIASLEQQASTLTDAAPAEVEPSVASLAARDVNSRILSERIESLKARRANLEAKHASVSETVEGLNKLIVKVPEVQVFLGNLERRHENMRARLEELSSKLDDATLGERLELDKQAERFEVIEQPITPTDPIRPNRPMILLGGLGFAAAAAVAIAFLLEMLNRTVRSTADVTNILGQAPLATIPYITTAGELRRDRKRLVLTLLLAAAVVAAALLAVHFAYMPLDEVMFKTLRRFGF